MTETPTGSLAAIEALVHERRTFLRRTISLRRSRLDESIYRRAAEDPAASARSRQGAPHVGPRADQEPRVGSAPLHLVRGRAAERLEELPRPPRRGGPRRPGRLPLGRGARGRDARCHVRRAPLGGLPARRRSARAGCREGRPVGIYMGMVPELPAAMLACANRRAARRRLRRLLDYKLAERLRSTEAKVLITQDEGWRRQGAAEGEC